MSYIKKFDSFVVDSMRCEIEIFFFILLNEDPLFQEPFIEEGSLALLYNVYFWHQHKKLGDPPSSASQMLGLKM